MRSGRWSASTCCSISGWPRCCWAPPGRWRACAKRCCRGAIREKAVTPRYLDRAALPTPTLALANAAREVLRIGDRIEQMLDNMLRVLRNNDAKLAAACRIDNEVDDLYTAIKLYLTRISWRPSTSATASAGPRSSR